MIILKWFSKVKIKKGTRISIVDMDGAVLKGVLLKTFRSNDEWIIINTDDSEWTKFNMLFVKKISVSCIK